jgi:hypothetical protein
MPSTVAQGVYEMNSAKNGRRNKTRITRTYHLAPTTRAIRAALAASFTALALAGSVNAFAGTCSNDAATNTESCDGDFSNLPGGSFVPVVDMTLVLGDSAPTSVTPAAGTVGIEASWGGDVGVITDANITTDGADGIHQYGSTSATLSNTGSISTAVTAAGVNAVDIGSSGNVSVVNSGDIAATATGAYDVTTVSAYSINGNVSFDNKATGMVTASAQDGNAIAVAVSADGNGFVYNEGAIVAHSDNGIAIGVLAYTGYLAIARNHGSIAATSDNGQATGEAVVGGVYSYAFNDGTITATSGHDQATGIAAYGTTRTGVYNSGSITATGTDGTATGVLAQSSGIGRANVTNSGSIQATSSYHAAGVLAVSDGGYAVVHNDAGAITATGTGTATATGVAAYSAYGSYVVNSGIVTATTDAGPVIGVAATTNFNGTGGGFGDASITNSGSISATSTTTAFGYDGSATGALVQTIKGGARVYNSGTIAATVGGFSNATGVSVGSSFAGVAYVGNTGSISASAGSRATGVEATSHYGSTTIVNEGDISALSNGARAPYAGYAQGIVAASTGAAGFVPGTTTVTNAGNINATANWLAEGIEASAGFGVATVTNTATGTITVTGDANAIGIGTGHDSTGYVYRYGKFIDQQTLGAVIDNAGTINVVATGNTDGCGSTTCIYEHANAAGIQAVLSNGKGITITNSGKISATAVSPTTSWKNPGGDNTESVYGIQAITDTGDVTIDNSGSIAISATGVGSDNMGIRAYSRYGSVSVINSGSITGSLSGPFASMNGILAQTGYENPGGTSDGGGIHVVNSGDITTDGQFGIEALSSVSNGNTTVEVDNSGHLTVLDGRGIFTATYSDSPTTTVIDNSGSITAETPIFANMWGSGPTTITNSGQLSAAHLYSVSGVYAGFGDYSLNNSSAATVDNRAPLKIARLRPRIIRSW